MADGHESLRSKRAAKRAELLKAVRSGGKTPLEQSLAEEERKEREAKLQQEREVSVALDELSSKHGGEPTKFEQAVGEVYCWWNLPAGITAKDLKVEAFASGSSLIVQVKDHVIFRKELFSCNPC